MKTSLFRIAAATSLVLGTLIACGGGGDDEAGSLTPFSVVPKSVTITNAVGAGCAAGFPALIYIYGGAAPYRVDNTFPSAISVDRTEVGKNGSFTITTLGGCVDPAVISIVDSNDRQVTLEIVNKEGT